MEEVPLKLPSFEKQLAMEMWNDNELLRQHLSARLQTKRRFSHADLELAYLWQCLIFMNICKNILKLKCKMHTKNSVSAAKRLDPSGYNQGEESGHCSWNIYAITGIFFILWSMLAKRYHENLPSAAKDWTFQQILVVSGINLLK